MPTHPRDRIIIEYMGTTESGLSVAWSAQYPDIVGRGTGPRGKETAIRNVCRRIRLQNPTAVLVLPYGERKDPPEYDMTPRREPDTKPDGNDHETKQRIAEGGTE